MMIANVSILLLASLCLAYVGLNAYALLRANALIFPVPPSSYEAGPDIVYLNSDQEISIASYYLSGDSPEKQLLIYSHGNGEDIGSARPFLELFQKRGISVLAYDYPGYGMSGGDPSERGCYAAIQSAYEYAVDQLGYDPAKIVLYGRSLGSGPSTWLAERRQIGAIILDGAFTSTFRVLTEVKLLLWDRFDNYARFPNIRVPILLVHGTEDRTVPFSHALRNWKRIEGPKQKLFVVGARHSNVVEMAGAEYWEAVLPFIHLTDQKQGKVSP
jgi:pimeloyl-ACP methyl ester carboxylesterase